MNKKTILTVLTIAVLLMPVLVLAVSTNLNTPTPPTSGTALTLVEIEILVRRVAQFLIIVSVIIAVIFIICQLRSRY